MLVRIHRKAYPHASCSRPHKPAWRTDAIIPWIQRVAAMIDLGAIAFAAIVRVWVQRVCAILILEQVDEPIMVGVKAVIGLIRVGAGLFLMFVGNAIMIAVRATLHKEGAA